MGGCPDGVQRFEEFWGVVGRGPSWFSSWAGRSSLGFEGTEFTCGVFAVVTADGAELVEDLGLLFSARPLVTERNRLEVFFFRYRTHNLLPWFG